QPARRRLAPASWPAPQPRQEARQCHTGSENVSPDPRLNGDGRAIVGDAGGVFRLRRANARSEILPETLVGGDGPRNSPALVHEAGDDDGGSRRGRDADALAITWVHPLQ